MVRTTAAPDLLLALARARGRVSTEEAIGALDVSRATAHRRLSELVRAKRLARRGEGRDAHYVLPTLRFRRAVSGLAEDALWREMEPGLADLGVDATGLAVAGYAVTELVNNVIDHSGAKQVTVTAERIGQLISIAVQDEGIGAFARAKQAHGFSSLEDALLALEKGKLTSDPARHSGEGLFFVSKAVTRFRLESGPLAWIVDNEAADTSVAVVKPPRKGTCVSIELVPGTLKPLADVFRAFTDPETLAFTRTRTTVKLAAVGTRLLSRSEAKRVLVGADKFETVELDFHGVELVGQGFCDEVFRVFAAAHRDIELVPLRMNDSVAFMVKRARASASRNRSG
jgi:anti-sigma regulatory factor (Ser/Thr protein kinase)